MIRAMINLSILIPVYNEEKFINAFWDFLQEQDLPSDSYEVIFIDGNSTDHTLEELNKIKERNENLAIKILSNPKRMIATSLNVGLKECAGDYVVRLDVHSRIPVNYLSEIYLLLQSEPLKYCNVGGRTVTQGYDPYSTLVAKALSNKWVIGGAKFRYSSKVEEVDTLFPGAWLKQDLLLVGGWNEEWKINEDVELNCRLRKETLKKIMLNPSIEIFYFPRNTMGGLVKQYFNYGYWRIKTANAHQESIRLSHILPLFVLFWLLAAGGLLVLDPELFLYFAILSISLYAVYMLSLGMALFKPKDIAIGLTIIFIVQSSWIIGSYAGYVKFGFPFTGYLALFKRSLV
ncbi:glycosyltransferase [Planomicrobium okeanokoites]|nr:glycosyltransferase [Planomicrobium okeanokoites]